MAKSPEGTIFNLAPGVYRLQQVTPKNNDAFIGAGTVILNGSQIVAFHPTSPKNGRWVADFSASSFSHGRCRNDHPLCGYIQDLFINNQLQMPVGNDQNLSPGSWYFDRARSKVYLPFDPSGKTVEIGLASYAFAGNATGIRIENIIVEKYACAAQTGAIGGQTFPSTWIVNRVEARFNHGRGISLGSGSVIENSFAHHNGQLGISLTGANAKALNNEVSWNNYAGFDSGWEAGGSKFSRTSSLVIHGNYVHDNNGRGLWSDIDNSATLYDTNTVTNNANEGITHEVSYSAIIRNNIVRGNGNSATVWLWNAQILIQNSSNVEVYGNTVEIGVAGGNGIAVINQKRGSGANGPWVASGNYIHDNSITALGEVGATGFVDDSHSNSAQNNRFDRNHYFVKSGAARHWAWGGFLDWNGFTQAEQELHGTCCK